MALHRIRARLRFTTASGMATWCRDNMAVRHGQAVHINEGLANEELKFNEVVASGDSHQEFRCDLPLMDEAAAVDAFSTLTPQSLKDQMVPLEDEESIAFVEHHTCGHDESPPLPCVVVDRYEVPIPEPPPEIEPWVQPTGTQDAYNMGDQVTHNGATWTSTVDANTWEPGVFGWSENP